MYVSSIYPDPSDIPIVSEEPQYSFPGTFSHSKVHCSPSKVVGVLRPTYSLIVLLTPTGTVDPNTRDLTYVSYDSFEDTRDTTDGCFRCSVVAGDWCRR